MCQYIEGEEGGHMSAISEILKDVKLPQMVRVHQQFDQSRVEDVPGEVRKQLAREEIAQTIRPGMRIAITCGSRGLDNLKEIIRTIVEVCKQHGAEPFIIPAMGSHGGATAQGQREICESFGVTEAYCGCPLRATMEVTQIGQTPEGHPVLIDRYAAEADGIIVLNRVKRHTAFDGPYQSGIMKMMTIGLGKQVGASVCHRRGYSQMAHLIPLFGNAILAHANVLFAVALIENAYDQTCRIAALTREEIPQEEPKLLEEAKARMARLLPGSADALIIDWSGKNISGGGIDANITGRSTSKYFGKPNFDAGKVAVLNLTDESHGNMHGIGNADVICRRVFEKGDLEKTYPNSMTSTTLKADALPVMMKNDLETVKCALLTCNCEDPDRPRVIRIRDTLHISEILVSACMVEEVSRIPGMQIIGEPEDWHFDREGNIDFDCWQ